MYPPIRARFVHVSMETERVSQSSPSNVIKVAVPW